MPGIERAIRAQVAELEWERDPDERAHILRGIEAMAANAASKIERAQTEAAE